MACVRPRYWGRGGAGMMFGCAEDQTVLLLLRAHWVEQGGTWGVPGGGIGEGFFPTPMPPIEDLDVFFDKAIAEVQEECGSLPPGFSPNSIVGTTTYEDCGFRYVTFLSVVSAAHKRLWPLVSNDGETDAFVWVPWRDLAPGRRIDGRPLHFGVELSLTQGALDVFSSQPCCPMPTSARRTPRKVGSRRRL